ncbi:MAG: hypothetical protein J7452_11780 [Thermoflexus sp.]|nr:hypothetical protein [Thermoflexus sp.]
MVSLELVYYFAGGALIVGLLFGIVAGFALGGRGGGGSVGAPPPPSTETGVALIREPGGAWRIEVGKQRYRHLQEIHDHQSALLVLQAMQALQAMLQESTSAPRAEPRLQGPAPAEQLDRILQDLLREHPELPYPAVRLETLPDGTLGILVGTRRYQRIEDVPDPELRALLQEAVRRWLHGSPRP